MTNNKKNYQPKTKSSSTSSYGGISPMATEVPGDSIDEHRNIETANIMLTGDEIRQQNENL